jgi:hypothetical protein
LDLFLAAATESGDDFLCPLLGFAEAAFIA